MTWVLALLSLYATWLNARKVRWCFALWIVTNASWALVNGLVYRNYARAVLDGCYTALAVYGLVKWK